MEKYIPKSALVAEIESKIEKYTKRGEESDVKRDGYGMFWGGVLSCLNEVRTLCDTLEVKEVDLEKEIKKVQRDYKTIDEYEGYFATIYASDIEWIAKHFFELGMAVSLKAQKGE